jgi:preprotein translocase subunit SecD
MAWGAAVVCLLVAGCSSAPEHRPARVHTTFVPASALSADELQRSAAVLRTRLHLAHVEGASVTVTTFGGLRVSVPRTAAPRLRGLGDRDLVELRPVLAQTVVTGGPCRPGPAAQPTGAVHGCSPDGTSEYLLGGLVLDSTGVRSAHAERDPVSRTWKVQLTCSPAAAAALATATASASGSRLAITVDGTVLASPVVAGAITGRDVEITAAYETGQAKHLVVVLTREALPVAFHRSTGD